MAETQIEDEQWEFIRDKVEKMKEARETAQKDQQELKIEWEQIRETKSQAWGWRRTKASSTVRKRPKIQYYELKGG